MKKIINLLGIIIFLVLVIACEKDDDPENKEQETEETVIVLPSRFEVFPYSGWIYLSWNYNPEILQYTLYWTDDNTEPSESSNRIENIKDTYFQHRELNYTRTYKYKIQSINGELKSVLSNTVSTSPLIPPLEAPKNLSVKELNGSIILSWDPVNVNGIEYKLKRNCIPTDGYFITIAENLNTTSYTDQTKEIGKGYFYKVVAVDPANNITSEASDPVYISTKREVFEKERNNENTPTTLGYDTHYWDAEEITENLDWFNIRGGYTGFYSIYSSGYYKNFDADCFLIYLEDGDKVNFTLREGNMTDLWSMSVKVVEYGMSSTGSDREVICGNFWDSTDSFTYNMSNTGTVLGCYLQITSWEDLINYGPYNYNVEIRIERKL